MSTQVFPALAGLAWPVTRTPTWKTRTQTSISGKETRIADWSFPRWQWDLTFDFLRQGTYQGSTFTEMQQLAGHFNSMQGSRDSFLYADADDNTVTGQGIGTGDGVTKTFQLVRSFGGFVEPIYAPHTVSAIKLAGVTQGSGYTVSTWGSAVPGVVTFTSAPGVGVAVTADFTFYFPVRFIDDSIDFEAFMSALYSMKSVKFISLK